MVLADDEPLSLAKFWASDWRNDCKVGAAAFAVAWLLVADAVFSKFWKSVCNAASEPVALVLELVELVDAVLLEPLSSSCSKAARLEPVLLYGGVCGTLLLALPLLLLLLLLLLLPLAVLLPVLALDGGGATLVAVTAPAAAGLALLVGADGVAPWACARVWKSAPRKACSAWALVCEVLLTLVLVALLAALAEAVVAALVEAAPDAVRPNCASVCCSAFSSVLVFWLPDPWDDTPLVEADDGPRVDEVVDGDVMPFRKLLVPMVLIDMWSSR